MIDAINVGYSSGALTYIGVTNGMQLAEILAAIDSAVNTMNPAPDYTPYNLQCLRPTYTITNTQEFAESVADFLCTFRDDYDTFISGQYASDISTLTNAIDGVVNPGVTYSTFSITNADTLIQVLNKTFLGITDVINSIDPSTANWASITMSTPSTIVDAFNTIIAYELTQDADIALKEPTLGTFDNTDCLAGGATDTAKDTISLLKTYVCGLPTLDTSGYTWGCVTPTTTLDDTLQSIINFMDFMTGAAVISAGPGLTITSLGACSGNSVEADPTWTGYMKVAVTTTDANNATADYLENKIISTDNSITIDTTTDPALMDIRVAAPSNKVAVNSSDTSADYLGVKIVATAGSMGISPTVKVSSDNSKVEVGVRVDLETLLNNIFTLVQSDPDLLAKWCMTNTQCDGCLCSTVTDLVVTLNVTDFVLTWTPAGGTTTDQIAKYRPKGDTTWLTVNFNPANILGPAVTTTNAVGLNLNQVYEFQIDSVCPGDTGNGNITESIIYDQVTLEADVVGTVITVTQTPMPSVSTIQYTLLDQLSTPIETVIATGANPIATFASVASGTYTVDYRYGATVNGVTLYSDDPSQAGSWYSSGLIIV